MQKELNFGLLGGGRAIAVADFLSKQRNIMLKKALEESYTMGCGKGKKKGKGSKK